MVKNVRWMMIKENILKTWPVLTLLAIITILLLISAIVTTFPNIGPNIFNYITDVTLILSGLTGIILGFSLLFYKNHFKQLAIKYHKPYSDGRLLGYFCLIIGGFLIIEQIFLWLVL